MAMYADRVTNDLQQGKSHSGAALTVPDNFVATNYNPTITNTSSAARAAMPLRRYLMIQNNHATGIIYVVFGATATAALGIKIGPGQNYELNNVVPNNSVNIIGDIASNTSVVIVEG